MSTFSLSAPAAAPAVPDPLAGSTSDFYAGGGPDLTAKTAAFSLWHDARVAYGGFPFSKRLLRAPGPETTVRLLDGTVVPGLNFGSQDYLGLAAHPAVHAAACEAIGRYGVHSAGSPVFAGAVDQAGELEAVVADHLRMAHAVLFPTGWAAGYGAVRGLVRDTDYVVIDQLAHNCLHEGAAAATRNVHLFRHLDVAHARQKLASIRARDAGGGILLVTEGLFSMDSDAPDLAGFQQICRQYQARLLVDVAHDLGSMGPRGTGQIGLQNMLGQIDFAVGSFSKTFASNGGFFAALQRGVCDYLRYFSSTAMFSSALAPAQVATVLATFALVRSPEGERRRRRLMEAVEALRDGLRRRQVEVMGAPSPIVPVLVGRDDVVRTAAKLLSRAGVLTNLAEYPAVSRATARFRMQVMSGHEPAMCERAAASVAQAIAQGREACAARKARAA